MLEIVQTLPEITDEQIAFYKKNCFITEISESRGRCVCSDCGHAWKPENAERMIETRCPECGHSGHVFHNKATNKQIDYLIIADAVEGYQILRYIQVRRRTEAGKIYHWHKDVGSIMFDEEGNKTEFTLSRFTMGWILDAWSFDSEIEIRSSSSNVLHSLRAGAMITEGIIPVLERNGWDGKLFNYDASYLIKALLTNPIVESWWKIGHKGVVHEYLYKHSFRENTVRLVKLATRHGKIFRTFEEWNDFKDYINDLNYLKKDIYNPSLIFPENFQEAHRIWNERAARKRERERERYERQRRIDENNRRFEEMKKKEEDNKWIEHYVSHFSSMDFERSGFRFKPLLTADDFQAEADCMKHCIRSYYGKQDTLLLSVSYGGTKVETAEIDLKEGEVVQSRGLNNKPSEHHDTIVYMLKQYMGIFKAYNEGKFLKYAKNKIKKQTDEQPNEAVQCVA